MKLCHGCNKNLSTSLFGSNKAKKDGLQTRCKDCRASYAKDWYKDNKKLHKQRVKSVQTKLMRDVYSYLLQHPCPCGESRPECLDFDHIDPSTKINTVSNLVQDGSRNRVFAEIEKCQVLCSNCHRVKTAKQLGWYLALAGQETETLS